MTRFQQRLIIALDEWLGIALVLYLRKTNDAAYFPTMIAWIVAVYVISYPLHWYEWRARRASCYAAGASGGGDNTMWPSLRDDFVAFFTDKAFYKATVDKQVGRVRGFLLALGLAWGLYADQIAVMLGDPTLAKRIKLGGVILGGLAVMLRAGEKNKPEKEDAAVEQAPEVDTAPEKPAISP